MSQIFTSGMLKKQIEAAVEWLRSDDENDLRWQAITGHVESCLKETRRKIAEPVRPAYIGHRPSPNPEVKMFNAVLGELERMQAAMQERDRKRASASGSAVLEKLA